MTKWGMARAVCGAGAAGLLLFAASHRDWMGLVADWKAGDMKRLEVLVPGSWWWGAVLGAGILATLALTARGWCRPWQESVVSKTEPPVPRWFIVALVALVAAGALLRAPRLGLSFYNDESYSFRRHIAGAQTLEVPGKAPRFRKVTWEETCYQNLTGNNSMLFSVLGRFSYDTWRKASGAPPGTVCEWAVRLPVFAGGVLAVGAMGWLGMRLGGPRLGLLAALLTSLHPWHVRYSTEARCYGILLLLLPLLFLALRAALLKGRWRDWLAFGLLEYLTTACFFGSVHFLLGLNLLIAGGVFRHTWQIAGHRVRAALPVLVPLVVVGLLSAGLYLLLNLPLFFQTSRLVQDPRYMHNPFTPDWFQDTGSFLAFGIPGPARTADGGVPVSFAQAWGSRTSMAVLVLASFLVLLIQGGVRLVRQGGVPALIPLSTLAGAALTLGYCFYEGLSLLPWYSIFMLPGILFTLASGLEGWWDFSFRLAGPLPGALAGGMVLTAWGAVLPLYQKNSRENLRAVVEQVRGRPEAVLPLGPKDPLLGVFWSEVGVYDRSAVVLHSRQDLEALLARARLEQRECYVESMWRAFVMRDPADQIRAVEDPAQFERIATWPGLDEPGNDHVLWRMVGPAVPAGVVSKGR